MKFIPLDKSWIIRMGVLDIIHDHDDIVLFLNTQTTLSDDLLALKHACSVWNTDNPIKVGESGTLYRFLQFASWKLNLDKRFVTEGTLRERKIGQDSSLVNLTQRELLELPGEPTSQWASATVLLGDEERLVDAPYKLRVTYEAVDHWRSRRVRYSLPFSPVCLLETESQQEIRYRRHFERKKNRTRLLAC